MKIYISGRITNNDNYKNDFKQAAQYLTNQYYIVINPCCLPLGLKYEEYIHINKAMIDVSDAIYLLKNWEDSNGARIEYDYAVEKRKTILFQLDSHFSENKNV